MSKFGILQVGGSSKKVDIYIRYVGRSNPMNNINAVSLIHCDRQEDKILLG